MNRSVIQRRNRKKYLAQQWWYKKYIHKNLLRYRIILGLEFFCIASTNVTYEYFLALKSLCKADQILNCTVFYTNVYSKFGMKSGNSESVIYLFWKWWSNRTKWNWFLWIYLIQFIDLICSWTIVWLEWVFILNSLFGFCVMPIWYWYLIDHLFFTPRYDALWGNKIHS